jgi:hypothetical protein
MSVGTAQHGGRLVGRDATLAVTAAALAEAAAGSGGLLLVAGEPGIGKSAVLAEQARRAGAAGFRVLRGTCWQGGGAPPYWLWTQVVRGLATAELGDAAFLLDRAGRTGDIEAPEARFQLFDAVTTALAGAGPLLVMLDDLQWADDLSLGLLEFVRRGLADAPVLLLGAYRDAEAGAVSRLLAGPVPTVPLTGLDVEAVTALMTGVAGPAPDPELAERMHRRCGGNPFFVRELTRLMLARGDWHAAGAVPAGVVDTLRLRLARLSQPCVDLLAVAAVAGRDVELALLAEIGPDDAAMASGLLDEAERARVLVGDAAGLRFAHDLYRETVLAQLSASRRAQLHAVVGRGLLALSADGADPAAVGGAARLAAHFVAAGPPTAREALHWSVRAAQEATARLGHEDAVRHYATALALLHDVEADPARRVELLLGLAAAHQRAGDADATREAYLRAAELARSGPDPVALADAALGVAAQGVRSGTDDPVGRALLEETAALLADGPHPAVRSRVLAALARVLRHAALDPDGSGAVAAAREAVELAGVAGDPGALAHALHAQHDVGWAPGATAARLAVLADMATAAREAGDDDMVAEAVLLRAAALIEAGDPAGVAELARYTRDADQLGHARGRWGALSRRATLAQVLGRVGEAQELARAALTLGRAIGVPDATACFATLTGALGVLGSPPPPLTELLSAADPLWPVYPLLQAWTLMHHGDRAAAAAAVAAYAPQTVPGQYDLELAAISASVFAAVGSAAQRDWAHEQLVRHSGLHVLVGGCAAYHGAVDHHLGALAAASGRPAEATRYLTAAIEQYERMGGGAWAQRCRADLDRLTPETTRDTFRLVDGFWRLGFAGREVTLPDAKGLHDIAKLLVAPHRPVHVFALLGRAAPATGADPVLDRRAIAEVRARLDEMQSAIDDGDEGVRSERDALIAHLRAAQGLGGRPRRLGDDTERARKTVTARIRDALRRVRQVHPELGEHLLATVRTGTTCSYTPDAPQRWFL